MEIPEKMSKADHATMKRLNENRLILGTVVVNELGFPEMTNMDSLSAVKYSTAARMLSSGAIHAMRCVKPDDSVHAIRLVTKTTEVLIKPDPEFHLIAVMHRSLKYRL